MRPFYTLIFVMAGAMGVSNLGQADGDDARPAKSSSSSPERAKHELPAVTPEREAAALRFVAEHHPELGDVLKRLKTLDRKQYEQAIGEVFQSAEKLATVKTSDKTQHGLMLESWKVASRIDVLAARIVSGDKVDGDLEAELKRLLYRQVDLQCQTIEYNRQRLLASLQVMEANIKLHSEKRDEFVEKRLRSLTRSSAKKVDAPPKEASPAPRKSTKFVK